MDGVLFGWSSRESAFPWSFRLFPWWWWCACTYRRPRSRPWRCRDCHPYRWRNPYSWQYWDAWVSATILINSRYFIFLSIQAPSSWASLQHNTYPIFYGDTGKPARRIYIIVFVIYPIPISFPNSYNYIFYLFPNYSHLPISHYSIIAQKSSLPLLLSRRY